MGGRFYGLYYLNIMILLSFVGLYLFFVVDRFIWFYIIFELVVIPTLFMVVYWGVQPERWRAGVYLIMYTFFGSIPFLFSIIYVFLVRGVERIGMFLFGGGSGRLFIYFRVLLAFFIKLPLYGFHIWLPKAHVEAPIIGSIILAGVLLKLGRYGLLRFISLFREGFFIYNRYFLIWGLLGRFMVALVTWRQTDIKCFVAYSSVIHIRFLLIGVFRRMGVGKYRVVLMRICHGFVSCCLFFIVNLVYERCGRRSVVVIGGVFIFRVVFYLMWFLCLAINMGIPPTLNFFSELMLIVRFLS